MRETQPSSAASLVAETRPSRRAVPNSGTAYLGTKRVIRRPLFCVLYMAGGKAEHSGASLVKTERPNLTNDPGRHMVDLGEYHQAQHLIDD